MRTTTRYTPVRHVVDGHAEIIDMPYEAPADPRDWDHIALTAATIGAALLVVASIAWSTVSAGHLLAATAPEEVAYAAATAFDLVWIICLLLEWLARYDPQRARAPRRAGNAALLVAMAVLCAHGVREDSLAAGLAAAAISALAKGTWTLVMREHARPLDTATALWLRKRQARLGARAAIAAQTRHLERIEVRTGLRTTPEIPAERPEASGDDEGDEEPSALTAPMSTVDAVRTAVSSGITSPDAVLRYVRKRADANASEETVNRYLRGLKRGA
ncbi:protein transporter Sec31 [Streptomyces sp. NPDC101132]|uniref:protein transporter Sec31 n=1 Tax=Streptomyces sp. NPDC101132 TaxID=3366110 RepID=UPI0038225D7D